MTKSSEVLVEDQKQQPLSYYVLRSIRYLAASKGPGKVSFEQICDMVCNLVNNAAGRDSHIVFDKKAEVNELNIYFSIQGWMKSGEVEECNRACWSPCYDNMQLLLKMAPDLDPVATTILRVFCKIPKDQVASASYSYIYNEVVETGVLVDKSQAIRKVLDAISTLCERGEIIRLGFGQYARADGIHGYQRKYEEIYGETVWGG